MLASQLIPGTVVIVALVSCAAGTSVFRRDEGTRNGFSALTDTESAACKSYLLNPYLSQYESGENKLPGDAE
jgi:hypothetical protein